MLLPPSFRSKERASQVCYVCLDLVCGQVPITKLAFADATVLDIGGWIGITGMYYSTHAPRVIAVEPDITARSELVANVALNPVLEPRIRVYDK